MKRAATQLLMLMSFAPLQTVAQVPLQPIGPEFDRNVRASTRLAAALADVARPAYRLQPW